MAVSPILLERFTSLFDGNRSAYGTFKTNGRENEEGKLEGNARTERGDVAPRYALHLEGKESLGIVPINQDHKCVFGVIDIDNYKEHVTDVEQRVQAHNLPLTVFRSKSGGAHLYLFVKEFVSAKWMQETLTFFGIVLSQKNVEIFPKQTELEAGNVGNWINLPYFGGDDDEYRYAVINGERQTIAGITKELIENRKTKEQIDELVKEFPHKDAPPCLQYLLNSGGAEHGYRNKFLFNVAIYLKQSRPETWENDLSQINQNLPEPINVSELVTSVIASLQKKEYFYLCTQEPILSYCDKSLCKTRKYGIDSDTMPSEIIGDLIKYNVIPPIWELNINGNYVSFKTDELMVFKAYQKKCLEVLHTWPKNIKIESWRKIIEERLKNVVVQDAPDEASQDGQFKMLLLEFCTERAKAETRDQILSDKVYTEKGYHYFAGNAFLKFLAFNGFTYYGRQMVYLRFKELGGVNTTMRINKEHNIRVWKMQILHNPKMVVRSTPVDFETIKDEPF